MGGRIIAALERRRGGLLVVITGLLLIAGSATVGASAHPANSNSNGANQNCGAYCPSGVGQPSGNGNGNGDANGKPCAGCVGNADNKNPKGQFPNGTDANAGYECDTNSGVGQTNPAHSGCTHFQVDLVRGPVLDHLSDTVNYSGRVIDSTGG